MDWVGGEVGGQDTAGKKVGSGAANCYLEEGEQVNGERGRKRGIP